MLPRPPQSTRCPFTSKPCTYHATFSKLKWKTCIPAMRPLEVASILRGSFSFTVTYKALVRHSAQPEQDYLSGPLVKQQCRHRYQENLSLGSSNMCSNRPVLHSQNSMESISNTIPTLYCVAEHSPSLSLCSQCQLHSLLGPQCTLRILQPPNPQ